MSSWQGRFIYVSAHMCVSACARACVCVCVCTIGSEESSKRTASGILHVHIIRRFPSKRRSSGFEEYPSVVKKDAGSRKLGESRN
jgi:hypothetical protein